MSILANQESKFLILALMLTGCAQTPLQQKSGIDAEFRNARLSSSKSTRSPGVSFYQHVLSQTLASECDYFPSDSRYAQVIHQRCGSAQAIFRSMARVIGEPDAAHTGFPVVTRKGRVLFEDLPDDCALFN